LLPARMDWSADVSDGIEGVSAPRLCLARQDTPIGEWKSSVERAESGTVIRRRAAA
jgi:hypothetical protein